MKRSILIGLSSESMITQPDRINDLRPNYQKNRIFRVVTLNYPSFVPRPHQAPMIAP
jgi:hypothetical protein